MCSTQQPWAVSDTLAYGFAATTISGGTEASWCCACYELTFTSTAIAGKTMIVQATNTGGDLGANQFDLAVCPINSIDQSVLTSKDARRRIRNIQRLHGRVGNTQHRVGRSIWWHINTFPVRCLSRTPSIRLLLAFRLVRKRRQSRSDLQASRVSSCAHGEVGLCPRK